MAEIKEQRSAFSAHSQEAVSDWLQNPVTGTLKDILEQAVKYATNVAFDLVVSGSTTSVPDSKLAGDVRNAGTIIATLESVRSTLREAIRYANSSV